ncbi:MAG: 2-C-methyl-D-erythritol 2,4-cyclodiphosphate synthase [candidate division Zixibacteria bacterium]|nr:2-C-methyl-D-erythritol 2,4-cyclodiphosphate synthase [candidate division Zixibacteria bacterium]
MRVGHGFDVHRLVAGRKLVLGGIKIPFDRGLLGHSDADVLLHAVADALLGAAALGDIGKHFPPSDPKYKDADSAKLLAQVVGMTRDAGYSVIGNVDCIVMAERPHLSEYIDTMRRRLADILDISIDVVSIKATTCEGLGFVGREEGIAASAVCIILCDD